MDTPLTLALAQLNGSPNRQANLDACLRAMDAAQAGGAAWLLTPENTNIMGAEAEELLTLATPEEEDSLLNRLKDEARARSLWLLVGSAVVRHGEASAAAPLANRSLLINAAGEVAARYDKIHLFDADVADGVGRYRESDRIRPGSQPVLAETPWGKLGMAICYDLRFPHLFNHYARSGADFLALPAAFTIPTGQAHWHTLLRARAIENTCFMLAPAQTGQHTAKRATYGHSLAIDPWGTILHDSTTQPSTAIITLHPDALAQARRALPVLKHQMLTN